MSMCTISKRIRKHYCCSITVPVGVQDEVKDCFSSLGRCTNVEGTMGYYLILFFLFLPLLVTYRYVEELTETAKTYHKLTGIKKKSVFHLLQQALGETHGLGFWLPVYSGQYYLHPFFHYPFLYL